MNSGHYPCAFCCPQVGSFCSSNTLPTSYLVENTLYTSHLPSPSLNLYTSWVVLDKSGNLSGPCFPSL